MKPQNCGEQMLKILFFYCKLIYCVFNLVSATLRKLERYERSTQSCRADCFARRPLIARRVTFAQGRPRVVPSPAAPPSPRPLACVIRRGYSQHVNLYPCSLPSKLNGRLCNAHCLVKVYAVDCTPARPVGHAPDTAPILLRCLVG